MWLYGTVKLLKFAISAGDEYPYTNECRLAGFVLENEEWLAVATVPPSKPLKSFLFRFSSSGEGLSVHALSLNLQTLSASGGVILWAGLKAGNEKHLTVDRIDLLLWSSRRALLFPPSIIMPEERPWGVCISFICGGESAREGTLVILWKPWYTATAILDTSALYKFVVPSGVSKP